MIIIPCDNSTVDQKFQVDLEGTTYTFGIRWNERAGYWIMCIAKEDDTEIINGVPLLLGTNLLESYKSEDLPPGIFVFIDTSNQDEEATVDDLGDRCQLVYIESDSELYSEIVND